MVEGLRKGIEVLDALSQRPEGAGARELADQVALPRSTVQRLLQTLEVCGMVEQEPVNKRYRLGRHVLQLGMVCLQRIDVRAAALPYMRSLVSRSGETVGLNIRIGDARMYVEQLESPHLLKAKAEVGQPYPLHSGSPGRTLLAFLDDDEIARILDAADFSPLTSRTPTTAEQVLELVREIRERRYAIAFEETIGGLNTIAAPVLDFDGRVAAALSVSGPTTRFDRDAMDEVRQPLLEASDAISRDMGFAGATATATATASGG